MRRLPGRMPHGAKLLLARIKERNLTRSPRILNWHQGLPVVPRRNRRMTERTKMSCAGVTRRDSASFALRQRRRALPPVADLPHCPAAPRP
jgi:hypothetical protein